MTSRTNPTHVLDMTSTTLEQFLHRIDAFLERTGMSQTAFGLAVCNDGSFVTDLRRGKREPRLSTIDRVEQFMSEHSVSSDDTGLDAKSGRAA